MNFCEFGIIWDNKSGSRKEKNDKRKKKTLRNFMFWKVRLLFGGPEASPKF
jgi:hypothetical protein